MLNMNTGRASTEPCPARMEIRYLLIVFTLLSFARQSHADIVSFEALLSSSESPAETAIICAPIYDRFSAAMELALAEAVRRGANSDQTRGIANSFFQNRYRWVALKEAARKFGLDAGLDLAYNETADIGMDELTKFREECGVGVNQFIHGTAEMHVILLMSIDTARLDLWIIIKIGDILPNR
jgi:hypothetical protein